MSAPLSTRLAVHGDEFAANARAMGELVEHVHALHNEALGGGGPQYVARHRARGKMMVRDRLEALVDPGTPVLELCPLAGLETGDPWAEVWRWRWRRSPTPSVWSSPTIRRSAGGPPARPPSRSCCGRWTWPGTIASHCSCWSSRAGPTCPVRPMCSSPAGSNSVA